MPSIGPAPLEGGMVDDYVQVKHGRKAAEYPHPVMKDVLEETHGVMVYQEQVMRIINRLGGIELSNAYSCIKAISKKKLPLIAKYREQFVAGAVEQGLDRRQSEDLFGMIEKFAGYGFNKSHSTAYALIAYMTAYLKAHWPVEFMAALLSGDIAARNFKKKDPLVEHLEDCRRMNIEVAGPDVNRSHGDFTVRENRIHVGMCAIKGCGEAAAAAIVAAREKGGEFRSLYDFCERVDAQQVGRATIESLVKAGAFDSCGARRAQLMAVVEKAVQAGAAVHADRRSGQKSFFDALDDEPQTVAAASGLPDVPEWDSRTQLAAEKEVLGYYLTSHPLAEHATMLKTYCSHSTLEAASEKHRTDVVLGGMVSSVKVAQKKGSRPGDANGKYAMFDLEDMGGILRCILWSEQYAEFGHLLSGDAILVIRGAVDRRPGSEEANLIVNELIPLDQVAGRFTRGLVVRVSEPVHGTAALESLHEIVRGYPGKCELQLVLSLADGTRVTLKSDRIRVDWNPEIQERVEALLGPGNVRLIAAPPPPSNRPRQGGRPREMAYG